MKKIITTIGLDDSTLKEINKMLNAQYEVVAFEDGAKGLQWLDEDNHPDMILSQSILEGSSGQQVLQAVRSHDHLKKLPFIFIIDDFDTLKRDVILNEEATDYFALPIQKEEFVYRINALLSNSSGQKENIQNLGARANPIKTPVSKRIIDLLISSIALLMLSPLLLLVIILIKLESAGPVLFVSRRIGAGHREFDLYKFRTMVAGAQDKLNSLKHLNMYSQEPAQENDFCEECAIKGTGCSPILISDGAEICEAFYNKKKEAGNDGVFMKIKEDPRITRLGKFLRNSSIDEIPQLFNVLKGDMSIVGNRPLPLYEAEKLTTDDWTARFLAPAGLTGLWQISKRGKKDMSFEERIELDNVYAETNSLWLDIKIILKTFRALLQSETV